MTFTNEQLTEIELEVRELLSLLCKNAAIDDKLIADLELRVAALEAKE